MPNCIFCSHTSRGTHWLPYYSRQQLARVLHTSSSEGSAVERCRESLCEKLHANLRPSTQAEGVNSMKSSSASNHAGWRFSQLFGQLAVIVLAVSVLLFTLTLLAFLAWASCRIAGPAGTGSACLLLLAALSGLSLAAIVATSVCLARKHRADKWDSHGS
jgi:hypothetical protein